MCFNCECQFQDECVAAGEIPRGEDEMVYVGSVLLLNMKLNFSLIYFCKNTAPEISREMKPPEGSRGEDFIRRELIMKVMMFMSIYEIL